MPYLKKEDRDWWEKPLSWVVGTFTLQDKHDQYDTCNLLYHTIRELLLFFLSFGEVRYKNYERMFGALCCCHREFLRRVPQGEVDFNYTDSPLDFRNVYHINQMYDYVCDKLYSFDDLGGVFNFFVSTVVNFLVAEGYALPGNVNQVFEKLEKDFYFEIGEYEDLKIKENGDVFTGGEND